MTSLQVIGHIGVGLGTPLLLAKRRTATAADPGFEIQPSAHGLEQLKMIELKMIEHI